MKFKPNFWQKLASWIYPYNLERVPSKYSGHLEANIQYGTLVIDSPKANYSFGNLHLVFREAIGHLKLDFGKQYKVLILGFGAGSIAHILLNEMRLDCSIKGIELDDTIIQLAKKYFPENIFMRSQIEITDAYDYMQNQSETYDLILIDLFIDTYTPSLFQSEAFFTSIKKALNPNGQILMNTMSDNELTKASWKQIFRNLKNISVQENEVLHYSI